MTKKKIAGPRNPVSQLSGWQLLRLTVTQFLALCGSQVLQGFLQVREFVSGKVALEEALQVYAAFWQLYLEARATTAARDDHKKPKFQAGVRQLLNDRRSWGILID